MMNLSGQRKMFIILLFSLTSMAQAEKSVELQELMNLAVREASVIQEAKARMEAEKNALYAARANLGPRLELESQYSQSKNLMAEDLPDSVMLQMRLRALQPVFDSQRFHQLGIDKTAYAIAEQDYQQKLQDVIYDLARNYIECSRLQNELALVKNISTDLAAEKTEVEQKIDLGIATRIDLMNIEMQRSSLNIEEIELKKQLTVTLEELKRISQFSVENCYLPVTKSFGQQILAFEDHPIAVNPVTPRLIIEDKKRHLIQKDLLRMRRQWLPSIYLFSQADYISSDRESVANYTTKQDSLSFGLLLNWQIGLDSVYQQKSIYDERLAAEFRFDDIKSKHLTRYSQLLSNMLETAKQVRAYEEIIIGAERIFHARQQVFELGQSEYIEVLRARRELFELQRRMYQVDFLSLKQLIEILYEQAYLRIQFFANLSQKGEILL